MALGFGFNKTKVLASAEKYVQQGKLQNAIGEYEKIVKEDPKDLTTLNTIGDLYARSGQNEKACFYFKKVGDAYSLDGFTVKAIALYKKLTKLNPQALDAITKLAELYTQQGLYNDARSQYVQVADQCLRSGNNEQAVSIFQKILELDPENAAMRAKLADLYTKMGKKQEARNLYFSAAQSLYGRGALDAADEALGRVLSMEPNNAEALLLRGQIAADSGDAANAIHYLEKIPNLDSLPDGLRAMLRALLQSGRNEEAEPLATKLLTVHNDPSGLTTYADSLLTAGKFEAALKIYDSHADRFLSSNASALLNALHASIGQIKNSAPALETLRRLYLKAGVTTHVAEISELLAHAWVEAGELPKARDLYKELAELEPDNELHLQSYKQVVARLGEDSAVRPLTPEEGAQAFMVDELEHTAPTVEVTYSEEVGNAVKAAITDSELFDSYNLPAKAIGPLEAVLPKAPRDPQVNQRLASLYARANRFEEAARCCDILSGVYTEAGHGDQARQYREMASKYRERKGQPGAVEPPAIASAAEFTMEVAPPPAEPVAAPAGGAHEEDLSSEWESMTSVEAPPAEGAAPPPPAPVEAAAAAGPALTDVLEEAGFYLSQSMWNEASAALDRAEGIAPGSPRVTALREQLAAATAPPAAFEMPVAPEAAAEPEAAPAEQPSVAEFIFDSAAVGVSEAQEAAPPTVEEAPPPPPLPPPPPPKAAPPPPPKPAPPPPKPAPPPKAAPPPPPPPPSPKPAPPAAAGDVLGDFVLDLEQSLGDDFAIAPAKVGAPPPPPPKAAPPPPSAKAAAPPPSPPPPAQPEAVPDALGDLFAEFKEDVETTAAEAEDPDTHYNLGVAFKEMGLLDEAIGELQKVCQAIETGHPFSQVMQAYTWLAHCFVEKGVPQAAIKWYQKALKVDNLTTDSKLAVYYDLASAQEAAGDTQGALSNFMEVYGTNIDYRDVAERIKGLKS